MHVHMHTEKMTLKGCTSNVNRFEVLAYTARMVWIFSLKLFSQTRKKKGSSYLWMHWKVNNWKNRGEIENGKTVSTKRKTTFKTV